MSDVLLQIENAKIYFQAKSNLFSKGDSKIIKAVDGVSLSIGKNEIHGLVGESGSGKSTLGRAIMGLNVITGGKILFDGRSISSLSQGQKKKERLKIQMVFQDPNNSLPPHMKTESILGEPILLNRLLPKNEIGGRVRELLKLVDLPPDFVSRYPHQLSGGQKQRVAVARAMALKPQLIVADEPTSALDVSVQTQILNLLLELKETQGLSVLFISHNLSVVRHMSDSISVMSQGKIVEQGNTKKIFETPENAYTKKLLAAIPQMKAPEAECERKDKEGENAAREKDVWENAAQENTERKDAVCL
ncbi:MAG: ATP-binding cassette domain-containing protein [Peptococcaceae bacterium]|nr:ATP-binding cassette domain-containing protein [Peptococcaceae bacterium]